MGGKHRTRRELKRHKEKLREYRLIIIATEGKKTEKQYFDLFTKREEYQNSKIKLIVIPAKSGKTSPDHIFRKLKSEIKRKDIELSIDDQVWMVIDRDDWNITSLDRIGIQNNLNKANFNLALSNPCFELWLLLHFTFYAKTGTNCKTIIRELKKYLPNYDKSNLEIIKLESKIITAISNAKKLDKNSNERWPSGTGTHVYKVVEEMLKLIENKPSSS